MNVTYYKRYRMEADLRGLLRMPLLPEGYRLVPWSDACLTDHADVKHHSFRDEIDAEVFDCLGTLAGCNELMAQISQKPNFAPQATWLVEYVPHAHAEPEPCGTIQGLRATPLDGAIQNVGVTPWHRSRGLGRALVTAAMLGFQEMGLRQAYLEVTADNAAATRVYRALGFCRAKTVYRAVELAVG